MWFMQLGYIFTRSPFKADQDTLFPSVYRASVRETEGTAASLTTLLRLIIGTERIKRRRNLR